MVVATRRQLAVLTEEQLTLVKKTFPLFEKNSYDVAVELYAQIFKIAPSVRNLFTLEFLSQKDVDVSGCPFFKEQTLSEPISSQARILSQTIVKLASSIENLQEDDITVYQIVCKHVSRDVRVEHHEVVRQAFVLALRKVAGDALTEEEFNAWISAVCELAEIFIRHESEMREQAKGGWEGFRAFRVSRHEPETYSTKIVLGPVDDKELCVPEKGQFVCMRMDLNGFGSVHQSIFVVAAGSSQECDGIRDSTTAYEAVLSRKASKEVLGTAIPATAVETSVVIANALKEGAVVDLSVPLRGGPISI